MDAAEALIADQGVAGVSLRAINAAAGVSPGILHYHFGSLDGLVEALVARHMETLMQQRRHALEQLSQAPKPGVRQLLEILVLPLARLAIEGSEPGQRYVRLIARLYQERHPALEQVSARVMGESRGLQLTLLQRALPTLPATVVEARLALANHLFLNALAELDAPGRAWQTPAAAGDEGRWWRVARMMEMLVGGFLAECGEGGYTSELSSAARSDFD